MNFINRLSADGKTRERMTSLPIVDIRGVSPDGRWLVAMSARGDNLSRTIAIPGDGGSPRLLCNDSCRTAWSPDGRRFFMWKGFFAGRRPNVVVPIPVGRTFPEFPADDPCAQTVDRAPRYTEQIIVSG